MPKKRNREIIMEQAMYDMLLSMNKNLIDRQNDDDDFRCIMDALGIKDIYTRCNIVYRRKCDKCIEEWLNEFPF